jgi:hypothetical protein
MEQVVLNVGVELLEYEFAELGTSASIFVFIDYVICRILHAIL